MKIRTLCALVTAALASLSAAAAPNFVNGIDISAATLDATGAQGANQGRVGFFSDIYYDPNRNEWWGLSDRGPGGGTLNYDTRVQRFTLNLNPNTGAISDFNIVQTIKFSRSGSAMNGIAPNPTNVLGNALDPEGFVVNPLNGNFLVSDEYGPSLYEFNRSGGFVRAFSTPANLLPRSSGGTPNFAGDTGNTLGKRTNRGFEGLAVSPDGHYAYAMLQSSMLDEGGGNGVYNRIVKFDTFSGNAVAQYAYQMDTAAQGRGISSLVALNDHQFMVLERNNRGIGVGATLASPDKRVYQIDLNGATDVSGITLPGTGWAGTPVSKSGVLIDLDANTLAALGNLSPEKWEGLTIGPRLADGSFAIIAGTDNDYSVTQNASNVQFDVYYNFAAATATSVPAIECPLDQTTGCVIAGTTTAATLTADSKLLPGVLHAYKTAPGDLAGYVGPVPEPESYALLLVSVGLVSAVAARRKARLIDA
jgi:hypothetical protein